MNPPLPTPAGDAAARHELDALRAGCRSAILATINADGSPEASYAPFADDGGDEGALLVLVSGLARHAANLVRHRQTSVLLIEDESAAAQIFGRRRVTFACRVEAIERATAAWNAGIGALQARHGAPVATLRELSDFTLLRLVPERGSLVLGFGKAWRLGGPGCREIEAVGPK